MQQSLTELDPRDFIPGPGPTYQPSYSINGLALATGWSRSRIYRLLNEGALESYKAGGRTFIVGDSVRGLIENYRNETNPE